MSLIVWMDLGRVERVLINFNLRSGARARSLASTCVLFFYEIIIYDAE